MADFPQGDKLIIEELEFVDNYAAAYRIKQLKKENANLKRQLTKLKKVSDGNQINSKPANCAIFDVGVAYELLKEVLQYAETSQISLPLERIENFISEYER